MARNGAGARAMSAQEEPARASTVHVGFLRTETSRSPGSPPAAAAPPALVRWGSRVWPAAGDIPFIERFDHVSQFSGAVPVAEHLDPDLPGALGQHRLGPAPVADVPGLVDDLAVLFMAQVLGHLMHLI